MDRKETPKHAIDFILDLEKRGKRPSTIKRYQYDLEDYLAWIRVNELSYEDPKVYSVSFIQSYFDLLSEERNYSYRTLKRVFSVLKQYHHFLCLQKKLSNNPALDIQLHSYSEDGFTEEMFLQEDEHEQLLEIIPTSEGLTENQMKAYPILSKRNLAIFTLLLHHGLTLHEVSAIESRHLSFIQKELMIESDDALTNRVISLDKKESEILYHYYESIPAAVRPTQYSADPFFVAFDFKRQTYRWSYEENRPKRLTEIAIQKMIRHEIQRAGLRKGISAQHFRRTAILQMLQKEEDIEKIQHHFGMKTPLTLNRYYDYL
jgi:site-specific recombinase XerD